MLHRPRQGAAKQVPEMTHKKILLIAVVQLSLIEHITQTRGTGIVMS